MGCLSVAAVHFPRMAGRPGSPIRHYGGRSALSVVDIRWRRIGPPPRWMDTHYWLLTQLGIQLPVLTRPPAQDGIARRSVGILGNSSSEKLPPINKGSDEAVLAPVHKTFHGMHIMVRIVSGGKMVVLAGTRPRRAFRSHRMFRPPHPPPAARPRWPTRTRWEARQCWSCL